MLPLVVVAELVIGAVAFAALVKGGSPQRRLLVDAGEETAIVELDGVPVGAVSAGTHQAFNLSKGSHRVRALSSTAVVLADETFDASELDSCELLRVGAAEPLAIITAQYGYQDTAPPAPELLGDSTLTDLKGLHAGCSIDHTFPRKLSTRHGDSEFNLRLLCHLAADGTPRCALE